MASKGQKFNSYSPNIKQEILDKYHAGFGGKKSLAKEYGIPVGTISGWLRKTRLGIDIKVNHKHGNSGRHKEENINYKEKYEILKNFQTFLKAQREKK